MHEIATRHEVARPRAAVEVLFVDTDGAVMIVEPTDAPTWAIPGGPVARGEKPRAAADRTLAEQLGLDLVPDRLLVADWSPLVREEHVVFTFDGGELSDDELDAIELRPGDVDSWAFIAPEELFVMLEPRLTRRVTGRPRCSCGGPHGLPGGRNARLSLRMAGEPLPQRPLVDLPHLRGR